MFRTKIQVFSNIWYVKRFNWVSNVYVCRYWWQYLHLPHCFWCTHCFLFQFREFDARNFKSLQLQSIAYTNIFMIVLFKEPVGEKSFHIFTNERIYSSPLHFGIVSVWIILFWFHQIVILKFVKKIQIWCWKS